VRRRRPFLCLRGWSWWRTLFLRRRRLCCSPPSTGRRLMMMSPVRGLVLCVCLSSSGLKSSFFLVIAQEPDYRAPDLLEL